MKKSDETKQLFAALIELQAKLPLAKRDRRNEWDKYNYATLASVRETCKPLLSEHKLAVFHTMTTMEGESQEIILETMLVHTSGEWIQSSIPIRAVPFPGQTNKAITPRNTGSALTYAERYSFMAIIGMAPHPDEDDDGGEGSGQRRRTLVSEKTPDLKRDRIPRSAGKVADRGAGQAGPSGDRQVAGAPSQEEPPPPEDGDAPDMRSPAKPASDRAAARVDHFAEFLEYHLGSEDAAFKMVQACSEFPGDDGPIVVQSLHGLAKRPKWVASTIKRYNEAERGELPEYTKDWQPPAEATD